ncbi:alpha-ketoacid dehydrogenase subunit beta [Neptuniibacter halophilus]|uniref:alpha-ketoacid dehydrogenase subunit beta n=1 Tax=Neptuniibacter halophilus TaxID=651666 RepID=UPI00257370A8|nr:alpha-ketoacid dehydrogenase subunit beta [Neptuniibacter halophilus]
MIMSSVCLLEAVNLALASEMRRDPDMVLLGEDIGVNGGVFRATANLRDEFGLKRVMDTPLAENMIAGLAIGMASQGLKPVAEMQFMGFIFPALEQIICHAARLRNRTRGRLSCPLVIRAPFGGGIHAPEHHSESTEALLGHIPGLKVVIPSSPARAYGLLLAAIRDPDPVIFLEPKRIYRSQQQTVEDNGEALPIGRCFTLREGSDITLLSWGAMITETLQAADQLAQQGVSCEVIDLASISPLDLDTILASVRKTGRLVIIHEAPRTAAMGAEIAASVAEKALLDLQAPIARVTGYDTVMPYFRLEKHYLPNTQDIIDSVTQTLEFV